MFVELVPFCVRRQLLVSGAIAALILNCSSTVCHAQYFFKTNLMFGSLPDGTVLTTNTYVEPPVVFHGPNGDFQRLGPNVPNAPQDGHSYLRCIGNPVGFGLGNGAMFAFHGLVVSELTVTSPPVTISIVGRRMDGSVVSTNVTTDPNRVRTNAWGDFQMFNIDGAFTNLARVEIQPGPWCMGCVSVRTGFMLGSLSMTNGTCVISFPTQPNSTNFVQFTTNLHDWYPLPGANVVGTGGDTQIIDTNATPGVPRFYRLNVATQ